MQKKIEASVEDGGELWQKIVGSDASFPDDPGPFESENALLEMAHAFLSVREELNRISGRKRADEETRQLARDVEGCCTCWHRAFDATGDEIRFCAQCNALHLSAMEREILMVLLLDQIGLLHSAAYDCGDVLAHLSLPGPGALEAIRAMSPGGKLDRERLIFFEDPEAPPRSRRIIIDPMLVETFITGEDESRIWSIQHEHELHDKLRRLMDLFEKKVHAFGHSVHRFHPSDRKNGLFCVARRIDSFKSRLHRTLELHPDWGVARLIKALGANKRRETDIVLALVSKELGHRDDAETLFEGNALCRMASDDEEEVNQQFDLLRSDSRLIASRWVQPCGGSGALTEDTNEEIARTEYELGEKAIEILGLERRAKKNTLKTTGIREPKVRLAQLVLSPEVRHALDMALAQARHAEVLVNDWGLGEVIAYGRAVTLLFSGPPGTGKTASAEALAHELNRPLLVADYSKIQNCFVGGTEKNIVRTFRHARSHNAVLFWDEADAMFYDRDMGQRSWEVRDVNVLLQELEKYDGVCVLATNRKCSLDAALERRVSVKVEYERPDRPTRRRIWEQLLPESMPLAEPVDFERLSEAELSGGEIKNAVLNAARMAVARGRKARVTMSDFARAIGMETGGKWSGSRGGGVGFRPSGR